MGDLTFKGRLRTMGGECLGITSKDPRANLSLRHCEALFPSSEGCVKSKLRGLTPSESQDGVSLTALELAL